MEQGLVLLAAAALEGWLAARLGTPWAWPVGWIAACTGLAGLGSATGRPGLLGKRADGTLPAWSLALFLPWHALVRGIVALRRAAGREPLVQEVHPGWLLGGWPHRRDLFDPWPAVIDLTCELPRRGPPEDYLALPTWDATAPSPEALDRGVAFALDRRRAGRPVLVHCAAGHGRSATLMAAALVAAGLHRDWREAVAHLQRVRPGVRLAPAQRRALDRRG